MEEEEKEWEIKVDPSQRSLHLRPGIVIDSFKKRNRDTRAAVSENDAEHSPMHGWVKRATATVTHQVQQCPDPHAPSTLMKNGKLDLLLPFQ